MRLLRSGAAGAALAVVLAACSQSIGGETADVETTAPPPTPAARACPSAGDGVTTANVADPALDEISGIAASRRHPGIVWVHNDSGADAEVHAVRVADGSTAATFTLAGVDALDWEDIALGPGPENGVDYLYVGDVGDNKAERETVTIYRVPEPGVDAAAAGAGTTLTDAEAIEVEYPEGPRDAETLLVDPRTGDLFIVSKVAAGTGTVYRLPEPHADGSTVAAERLGAVPVTGSVTGGDISADGSMVGLRTYGRAFVFPRGPDASVVDALAGRSCRVTLALEKQGEAFAFTPDASGYLTVGELVNPPLWKFTFA